LRPIGRVRDTLNKTPDYGCQRRVAAFFQFSGAYKMQTHIKAYAMFVAFYLVTKVVIAPVVNKMNLPIIGQNL
jgi:hypothetical protein